MDTQPAVSVIIPHYNSVQKIQPLLASIPRDPRFEVIVVDDRSTDDISPLRAQVEEAGWTLLVNDRPKKGAGTARNIGLDHARGKWLVFSDADDYFVSGWDRLILSYVDSDYDEIFFAPTSIHPATGKTGSRHLHYENLVKRHHEVGTEKTETELRFGFYTPWSKMIRREIFTQNHIQFEEQLVANDVMAMTKCAFFSRSIHADPGVIYCATVGEGGLTKNTRAADFDTRIDTKIRRYTFLRDNLSKKHFRWTHADYYMAGSLVDAALKKKNVRGLLKKYRENRVPVVSLRMFEPSFFFQNIIADFKWRKEVSK